MTEAIYQNIRKVCSGVFSKRQTLQFAAAQKFDPTAAASVDISIKVNCFSQEIQVISAYRTERLANILLLTNMQ